MKVAYIFEIFISTILFCLYNPTSQLIQKTIYLSTRKTIIKLIEIGYILSSSTSFNKYYKKLKY